MIVTEAQVLTAMDFHERKHIAEVGPLDMIALPKAVSTLADLLGTMWYQQEKEAALPDTTKTAALLREALGLADPSVASTDVPAPGGDSAAPVPTLHEVASPATDQPSP